jgi:hypothetical protein
MLYLKKHKEAGLPGIYPGIDKMESFFIPVTGSSYTLNIDAHIMDIRKI